MQALQTKLETLTNQNSDCKQHIEVLKESLTAKEQRANTLQTEVNVYTFINTTERYVKSNVVMHSSVVRKQRTANFACFY